MKLVSKALPPLANQSSNMMAECGSDGWLSQPMMRRDTSLSTPALRAGFMLVLRGGRGRRVLVAPSREEARHVLVDAGDPAVLHVVLGAGQRAIGDGGLRVALGL